MDRPIGEGRMKSFNFGFEKEKGILWCVIMWVIEWIMMKLIMWDTNLQKLKPLVVRGISRK